MWLRLPNSVTSHVTPILKYLHWLKINQSIEYKLLSLIYKALTTAQPTYLHSLLSDQPPRATCSSSVVTLSRPPTSSLRITNRSFRYASPHFWNQLPVSFCQPCINHSLMMSHSLIHLPEEGRIFIVTAIPPQTFLSQNYSCPILLYGREYVWLWQIMLPRKSVSGKVGAAKCMPSHFNFSVILCLRQRKIRSYENSRRHFLLHTVCKLH